MINSIDTTKESLEAFDRYAAEKDLKGLLYTVAISAWLNANVWAFKHMIELEEVIEDEQAKVNPGLPGQGSVYEREAQTDIPVGRFD